MKNAKWKILADYFPFSISLCSLAVKIPFILDAFQRNSNSPVLVRLVERQKKKNYP
jgi:hypothetical protein